MIVACRFSFIRLSRTEGLFGARIGHATIRVLFHKGNKGNGMRVTCDVEETTLTNDEGYDVDSVEAVCRECGHVTESFGTDEPSEGHFHPEASDTFRQSLKRDARQWKIQGQLMAYC